MFFEKEGLSSPSPGKAEVRRGGKERYLAGLKREQKTERKTRRSKQAVKQTKSEMIMKGIKSLLQTGYIGYWSNKHKAKGGQKKGNKWKHIELEFVNTLHLDLVKLEATVIRY